MIPRHEQHNLSQFRAIRLNQASFRGDMQIRDQQLQGREGVAALNRKKLWNVISLSALKAPELRQRLPESQGHLLPLPPGI